jgi:hypothetical protein
MPDAHGASYNGEMLVLRSKKRVLIDTAGKWRQLVLAERWGVGRSVTALAERWTTSEVPEVAALCESHKKMRGLRFDEGWVAAGELDLVVVGEAPGGKTLLAPLALADEPLGPTVDEVLPESQPEHRGLPPPVEQASLAVFGVPASVIGTLRWRLLQASAAALSEARARDCKQALLLLHVLRSPIAPQSLAHEQTRDVEEYVRRLSHGAAAAKPGHVAGPLPPRGAIAFFVGVATPTA